MNEQNGLITAGQSAIDAAYDPKNHVVRQWLVDKIITFQNQPGKKSLLIVGEPGSGKTSLIAYLAQEMNSPRHFIRTGHTTGVIGIDPRSFLISIGAQLYQKYGREIFPQNRPQITSVRAALTMDMAEVVGRTIDKVYTLPFLPYDPDQVMVQVGIARGHSRVIGETIRELVDVTHQLDPITLLHVMLIDPLITLARLQPDERVLLLIDALDEGLGFSGNSIIEILPPPDDADFPPNLRLLMTSRRDSRLGRFGIDGDIIFLDDKESGYLQEGKKDARKYIDQQLKQPDLAVWTQDWTDEQEIKYKQELNNNSDGNFLYLYYYFAQLRKDVHNGKLQGSQVVIPSGLDEIYRFFVMERIRGNLKDEIHLQLNQPAPEPFIQTIQQNPGVGQVTIDENEVIIFADNGATLFPILFESAAQAGMKIVGTNLNSGVGVGTWENKYLPMLGVLAVVFEAVSIELLAKMAGVELTIANSFVMQLGQFVDIESDGKENCFRLYHKSFSDYLLNHKRNQNYPIDGPAYHRKIVTLFLPEDQIIGDFIQRLAKDNYALHNLISHLEGAGDIEKIHQLLKAETADQRNIWYQVKESANEVAGYQSDILRALYLAANAGGYQLEDRTQPIIDLECRYSLILASLNGLAHNIPPAMLLALVRHGIWLPTRGLAYIRQYPDKAWQVRALSELLEHLGLEDREEIFQEARSILPLIEKENIRAEAITILFSHYQPANWDLYISQLRHELKSSQTASLAYSILEGVEPSVPAEFLPKILGIGKEIGAPPLTISAIARRLSGPQRETIYLDLLEQANRIKFILEAHTYSLELYFQLEGFYLGLAQYHATSDIEPIRDLLFNSSIQALISNGSYEQKVAAISILKDLLFFLPPQQQALALNEVLVREMPVNEELIPLITNVALGLRNEILQYVQKFEDQGSRLASLADISCYLDESQCETYIQEVLESALSNTESEVWFYDTVKRLAPCLSYSQLQQCFAFAQHCKWSYWKSLSLIEIAKALPDGERDAVIRELLKTIPIVDDGERRKELWSNCTDLLTKTFLLDALTIVRSIRDENAFLEELPQLIPYLPASAQIQAFKRALDYTSGVDLEHEGKRAELIRSVAPNIPEPILQFAIDAAHLINQNDLRAIALLSLIHKMNDNERIGALEEVRVRIDRMNSPRLRAECLVQVAFLSPSESRTLILNQAIFELINIDRAADTVSALNQLLTLFPGSESNQVLIDVLKKPREGLKGNRVIFHLAPNLPEAAVKGLLANLLRRYISADKYLNLYQRYGKTLIPIKLGFTIDDHELAVTVNALAARLAALGYPNDAQAFILGRGLDSEQISGRALISSYLNDEQLCMLAEETLERQPDEFNWIPDFRRYYDNDDSIGFTEMSGAHAREYILAGLIPELYKHGERLLAQECIDAIQDMGMKAEAYTEAAPFQQGETKIKFVREALSFILMLGRHKRRILLKRIVRQMGELPAFSQFELWNIFLAWISQNTRQETLADFYCFTPLITIIGNNATTSRIYTSIEDIFNWWH